ncbi:MAG: ribosome small subunit-dependent GTPase A [Clostridia bacterium]
MKGKVIKCVGGLFTVLSESGSVNKCTSPKKLRYNDNDVYIGDNVEYEVVRGKGQIVSLLERKNLLLRPVIANVDQVFILLSIVPEPDLLLIDKVLINCYKQNITPILIINKIDLADQAFLDSIKSNYGSFVKLCFVSAKTEEGTENIKMLLNGKTTVLCGQSAVGKTSLLNIIIPEHGGEIGELSAKIERGKNTTRHSQVFNCCGGYIADTPGFSLLTLLDVKATELMLYYPDFCDFSSKCRFNMCSHTKEPDCNVKKAVANGQLSSCRYERYLDLYKELIELENDKY